MPKVQLKFRDSVVREVDLNGIMLTIGRKSDNDLVIENLAVSGHHARIVKEDNEFFIEDVGSTNGMYVNETKIVKHQLRSGDHILIGKHHIVFHDERVESIRSLLAPGGAGQPMLGRYEIQKELGRGAMSVVYLGKDSKTGRPVAIKTLRLDQVDPGEVAVVKQRFFREAESAGKLTHPSIVAVYETGEGHGFAYFAMELLNGVTLKELCAKHGLLPLKRVVGIAAEVAEVLDYAHKTGVVHRDVKPANIMILPNGEVKITDFGIAKLATWSRTETGAIMGTPNYMSPEQLAGAHVDGRSDLFSLGIVLFELLTGTRPFQAKNIAELVKLFEAEKPPSLVKYKPDLPASLETITQRALQKDLDARYQRGHDMSQDLRAAIAGLPS